MSDYGSLKSYANDLYSDTEAQLQESLQRILEGAKGRVETIVRDHDELKRFEQRTIEFLDNLDAEYGEGSSAPAIIVEMVSHIYGVVMNEADPTESARATLRSLAARDAGPTHGRVRSVIGAELDRQHAGAAAEGQVLDVEAAADGVLAACEAEGIMHLVLPAPDCAGLDHPYWATDAGEISVIGHGKIDIAVGEVPTEEALAVAAAIVAASRHPKAAL